MRIEKLLIISLTAILLTAILLTGIYAMISERDKPPSDEIKILPGYWTKGGTLMNELKRWDNKTEDEITTYDLSSFLQWYGSKAMTSPEYSSIRVLLQDYNDIYPIERIKIIDNDHICVVYKLSSDKVENILTYVVFERQTKFLTPKDDVERAGFYECWKKTGEFYFLTNKLSSSDFDNLQVGDSVLSVCNIDPAVSSDYYYYCYFLDDTNIYFNSYRLLSDGIMVIQFKAPRNTESEYIPELSKYTVSSKTFYPYNSDNFPKEIKAVINAPDILN